MKKYNKILEAVKRGINIALDDFEDEEIETQKTSKLVDRNYTKEILDLYNNLVNLNLPSGTIWARFNVGVSPSDDLSNAENWIGNYYAWGETKPKEEYNYNTYLYHGNIKATNMKDYYTTYVLPTNVKDTLKPQDDAAYVNTNGTYRMPSEDEFDELIKYTTQKYVMNYNDISGLNGWVFKSKNNDKELFFPETYWKADDETAEYNVRMNYLCVAFYWGRTLDANMGIYLNLCKSSSGNFIATLCKQREFGMTIRGVLNK